MMQVYFLVKFASKLMNNLKKKRLSIIKQIYELSKYIFFFSAVCPCDNSRWVYNGEDVTDKC